MNNNQYTDDTTTTRNDSSQTNIQDFIVSLNNKVEKQEIIINKQEEALAKYFKFATEEITTLKKEQEKTNELIQELRKDKHNLIEILAIFVGIFTFLSVEIQILKSVTDFLRIAGLSIIIFAGLLFFITNLFFIAEKWINIESKITSLWWYNCIAIGILALGILLVGFGDYKNPAVIKNNRDFIQLEEITDHNKILIDYIDDRLKMAENNIIHISHQLNASLPTKKFNSGHDS